MKKLSLKAWRSAMIISKVVICRLSIVIAPTETVGREAAPLFHTLLNCFSLKPIWLVAHSFCPAAR